VPRAGLGPVTVEATVVAPGLYVYPSSLVEQPSRPADQWRIAHHSGRMIAHFPSEGRAVGAAGAIAPYANWRLGEGELVAAAEDGDIDLHTLGAVVDAYAGVLVRRRLILPTDFVHLVDQDPARSAHV
jgi:hypothetical protein